MGAAAFAALLAAACAVVGRSHTVPALTASQVGNLGRLGGDEPAHEEAEALAAADRALERTSGRHLRKVMRTGRRARARGAAASARGAAGAAAAPAKAAGAPAGAAPEPPPKSPPKPPGRAFGAPVKAKKPLSPLKKFEIKAEKRHHQASKEQHRGMKQMVDEIANLTVTLKEMKTEMNMVHEELVPDNGDLVGEKRKERGKRGSGGGDGEGPGSATSDDGPGSATSEDPVTLRAERVRPPHSRASRTTAALALATAMGLAFF